MRKFLLSFALLVAGVMTVGAQSDEPHELSLLSKFAGATWYNAAGNVATSGWTNKVVTTNTNPQITLKAPEGKNVLGWYTKSPVRWPALQAGNVFEITIPAGYGFTGYTLTTQATTSNNKSTFTYTTAEGQVESDTQQTSNSVITVTDLDGISTITLDLTNYNVSGESGIAISGLDVYYKVVGEEVTFTYSFNFGSAEAFATEEVTSFTGVAFPAPATLPYGLSASLPNRMVESSDNGKTIELDCEENLPFEYADKYANITNWYFIQMHSNNKKYIEYVATGNYIEWTDANLAVGNRDTYAWAFVGDPINGFKLVNKAAGNTLAVKSTNSGNPTLGAEGTVFKQTASKENGNGYFCLQYPQGNYLNAQNGKVAHYDKNDAGSTMLVSAYEEYTADDYATDLETLIAETKNFVTTHSVNASKIGCYTQSALDGVTTAVAEAEKYTSSTDFNELDAAYKALYAAKNATLEINVPQTGKFYRLRNASSNNYMCGNADNIKLLKDGGEVHSTVFYLDENNALLSFNSGRYLDCSAKSYAAVGTSYPGNFAIAYGGPAENVITYQNNGAWTFGGGADGAGLDKGTNTPNQTGYNWIIEEVTWLPVQISEDYGYGTLYSPVALSTYAWQSTTNHRVEAYVGEVTTAGNESWLNLTRIDEEDGVIPANTPVVLKFNDNVDYSSYKNGCVFLQVVDSEKKLDGTNHIKGTATNILTSSVTGGVVYTLQPDQSGEGVVFGRYTGTTLAAGKAYLVLPDNGEVATAIGIRFEGSTDIENVEIRNEKSEMIFDLLGRRVQTMTKGGIYIVNGKKVIK